MIADKYYFLLFVSEMLLLFDHSFTLSLVPYLGEWSLD